MPRASFLLRPSSPAVMDGSARGVVTVHFVMNIAAVVTMPVTVTGLRRYRNGQKNGGRYEESHHNSLPLSIVMSGVRRSKRGLRTLAGPIGLGQKDAIARQWQAACNANLARRIIC
jgi:hypothetical protein